MTGNDVVGNEAVRETNRAATAVRHLANARSAAAKNVRGDENHRK